MLVVNLYSLFDCVSHRTKCVGNSTVDDILNNNNSINLVGESCRTLYNLRYRYCVSTQCYVAKHKHITYWYIIITLQCGTRRGFASAVSRDVILLLLLWHGFRHISRTLHYGCIVVNIPYRILRGPIGSTAKRKYVRKLHRKRLHNIIGAVIHTSWHIWYFAYAPTL